MPVARADEEDQAPVVGDAFYDFGGAAEVRGCGFQTDDMDPGAHAVDIALVHGVPETGCVAEVGLRGHQELEGYIFGFWGVDEHVVRFVVWRDDGT